ncbi:MAG: hypothetical protein AAGK21_11470 [Bacteroidota bacterium]
MLNRLALFALALALPLAGCATDEAETTDTEAETSDVEMVDDAMTDDAADGEMADGEMSDDAMADDATGEEPAVTAQGTLDAVQSAGGLTSLAPAAAVQNIDGWIAQLEGNPDFAPTVDALNTLKGQLQAETLDGAAIGGTLQTLGQQTTDAAGDDAALGQLGAALTAAGDQLAGM